MNSIKSISIYDNRDKSHEDLKVCLFCGYVIFDDRYYKILTDVCSNSMCVSCFDTFFVLAAEVKGGHGTLKAIREQKEKQNEQS